MEDYGVASFFAWVIGASVCGFIGHSFGSKRKRADAGLMLGLLFGPIGWIMLLALEDKRPKCPECKGTIIEGATRCKNCGSYLPAKVEPAISAPPGTIDAEGAIVKGNGEVFAIAIADHHVTGDESRAADYRMSLRDAFSDFASPRVIILATREPTGTYTYHGRPDLVRLLADTDPRLIPWRKLSSAVPIPSI